MKLDMGIMADEVRGVIGGARYSRQSPSGTLYLTNRRPHVGRDLPHEQDQCPCAAWATADEAWVAMTEEERAAWNDAVTLPGMSGYDYFMSWAVFCHNQGRPAPGTPPPSGGYSYDEAFCVGGNPAPPECVKAPPPPVGEDCPNCPALTPAFVDAQASGFGPPHHVWNGTHKCPQDIVNFCHWHKWHHPWHITPMEPGLANQRLRIFYEGTFNGGLDTCTFQTLAPADCYEENVLPFQAQANVPVHPDSVLWVPGQAP